MDQKLNAITIAATDVAKLKEFYCSVFKWQILTENEKVVMFSLKSAVLTLCDEALFKTYTGSESLPGKGVYLTINLASPNEVDETIAEVGTLGASITKPAEKTFWGGYSGFVADPEVMPGKFATTPSRQHGHKDDLY